LFLLNFFNYHPRVLNAWVWKYLDRARDQFNRLQTVKERAEHIPLPVKFDDRIIEQPQAFDFREVFINPRTCMLIWGEGGSGKTSLACRLAKWGMGEDLDRPLSGFPMLPVIIEHDIHQTPGEEHPLVEAIDRQIEIMTGVDDIDLELLYRLLKSGRILVIVDRFSEMNAETRKIFQPGHDPKLKINSMIVTSRLDEPLQGAMMSNVQPLRIDRDHLLPFMVAYLHQEIFEDSEYFEACMRMSRMAGIRGITALLAKLYAEQMIGTREGDITIEDLPDNILDLMLSYLNWINRNRTERDPDDRTIHRISKAIARAALEHDFRPADASLHAIQTALANESDLDHKLTYMSEKLGVIRFVGASKNRLRITLDPLAEYLAGLRFIELYGSDEEQWRQFLDEMQKKHGVDGTVEGFLLAVIDCCLAEGREYGVPGFVETELARSIDIELKV